ncbi:MAG: GtrA family protein [Methylobacterium sp.]
MTSVLRELALRPDLQRLREVGLFAGVGAAASLVHLAVAVLLVEAVDLRPWQANVGAFVCALPVSYLGHSYLTFTARRNGRASAVSRATFARFLLLALAGFSLNQASVVLFAEILRLPFRPVMFVTIVAIAALQFVLGKLWAFKGSRDGATPDADAAQRGADRP